MSDLMSHGVRLDQIDRSRPSYPDCQVNKNALLIIRVIRLMLEIPNPFVFTAAEISSKLHSRFQMDEDPGKITRILNTLHLDGVLDATATGWIVNESFLRPLLVCRDNLHRFQLEIDRKKYDHYPPLGDKR